MKKIMSLGVVMIAVAAVVLLTSANGTKKKSVTLGAGNSVYTFYPTATEYLGGAKGLDTLNFEIASNKLGPCTVVAYVDVKSKAGATDTYKYTLQGRHFLNSDYVTIVEKTAQAASALVADTNKIGSLGSDKLYRYFQLSLRTDNDVAVKTDSIVFNAISFKVLEW